RVGDRAAAEGEREMILEEPEAIVRHETEKVLVAARDVLASGSAPIFTTRIEGERRRRLADDAAGIVVVLHHHAVVGVNAPAVGNAQGVSTEILIAEHREPAGRSPQDLKSEPERIAEASVCLPSVDQPGLNFELVAGEDLNAHSLEEPRGIRGDVRRLIRPVVELIVTPKPDVREEDARLDIDSVQRIDVIPAPRFGDVAKRVGEIPLAPRGACVVAWSGLRIQPELSHQPGLHTLPIKVATDAELSELEFTMPEYLGRAGDGVVLGMVVAVVVGD